MQILQITEMTEKEWASYLLAANSLERETIKITGLHTAHFACKLVRQELLTTSSQAEGGHALKPSLRQNWWWLYVIHQAGSGYLLWYAMLCQRSSSAPQPYRPNPNGSNRFPNSCIWSRQYVTCLGRNLTGGQRGRHHVCLGQAPILMLTRRSSHIKDSAIHMRVNLSRLQAVLHWCLATDKPSQLEATEEPAGSSHSILATTLSVLTFT